MPIPLAAGALNALRKGLLAMGKQSFKMTSSGDLVQGEAAARSKAAGELEPHLKMDIDRGQKFRDLERFFLSPGDAIEIAGPALAESIRRRFRRQRTGSQIWKARKVPNVAAIIGDLDKGTFVPSKRFKPRRVLVDTGFMMDSISWRKTGKTSFILFSPADYAKLHQDGGTATVKVTDNALKNLAKKREDFRARFNWLFKKDEITVNIPQRKFLVVLDEDIKIIQEAILIIADGRQRKSVIEIGKGPG